MAPEMIAYGIALFLASTWLFSIHYVVAYYAKPRPKDKT